MQFHLHALDRIQRLHSAADEGDLAKLSAVEVSAEASPHVSSSSPSPELPAAADLQPISATALHSRIFHRSCCAQISALEMHCELDGWIELVLLLESWT